jgi:DNA-binding NarL/FixJ family response regulator
VLLADDHAMVRAGLRQFLEEDHSITEIGEAASGSETLDRLRSTHWDLVILDINMPDRSGLDILRHIRAGYPDTKVLVVSGFPERQYALNVLKAGAGGYLAKDCAPEDLLKAARAVLQGRRYVSAELAEQLLADLEHNGDQPLHGRLSERRRTVLVGQDGQHLPGPDPGEDESGVQCGPYRLCAAQWHHPVAIGPIQQQRRADRAFR